jgi:hypothetical protein
MSNAADKIAKAVEKCPPLIVSHRDQLGCIYSYIKSLREVGVWTDAELVEVQAQALRAMMKSIAAERRS